MDDTMYETLKQTATAHIRAYEGPIPWDPNETLKHRTPECVHYLHPKESIPEAFSRPLYQEDYRNALNHFAPVIERFSSDISEMAVDVKQKMVTARITATFDFKAVRDDEPSEQGYKAEYMYLMEMDATGKKVVRFEEFLDVQRLLGYVAGKAERYNESRAGT